MKEREVQCGVLAFLNTVFFDQYFLILDFSSVFLNTINIWKASQLSSDYFQFSLNLLDKISSNLKWCHLIRFDLIQFNMIFNVTRFDLFQSYLFSFHFTSVTDRRHSSSRWELFVDLPQNITDVITFQIQRLFHSILTRCVLFFII